MSQTNDILRHLKSGKPLTALTALKLFDCLRLAARISDIRETHAIHTTIIKRGGKRYAEYRIV